MPDPIEGADSGTRLMDMFNNQSEPAGIEARQGEDPGDAGDSGESSPAPGKESGPASKAKYNPDHPYYTEEGDQDEPGDDEGDDGAGNEPDPAANEKTGMDPKANPDRYEFWQSKYSKAMETNQKLLEMLENNNGKTQGGTPKASAPDPVSVVKEKETALAQLAVPTKPTKPENYSAEDAYTNPDSASFRYRAAMDDYNEQFADVMSQRDQLRTEIYDMKLKMVEEPVRKIRAKEQLSEQQRQTVDSLTQNYQFNDQQALDFVEMMSKPDSMSMDNLVKFYRVIKGVKSPDSKSTNSNSGENRSRKREAAPPIPNGSGAGTSIDDDDADFGRAFGEGMLSFNR